MRIFFSRSFVSGLETSGASGPPPPLAWAPRNGRDFPSAQACKKARVKRRNASWRELACSWESANIAHDRVPFSRSANRSLRGVFASATVQRSRPAKHSEIAALTKKIDEQNTKIDTLSQQILKLEQQECRAGRERRVRSSTAATPAETPPPRPHHSGNSSRRDPRRNAHLHCQAYKSGSKNCRSSITSRTTGSCRSVRPSPSPGPNACSRFCDSVALA